MMSLCSVRPGWPVSEKFDPLLRDHLPKFETAWKHQDRVSIVQPANRNVFLSFKRFNISTTGL